MPQRRARFRGPADDAIDEFLNRRPLREDFSSAEDHERAMVPWRAMLRRISNQVEPVFSDIQPGKATSSE